MPFSRAPSRNATSSSQAVKGTIGDKSIRRGCTASNQRSSRARRSTKDSPRRSSSPSNRSASTENLIALIINLEMN
jgi:hypothetical protein